MKYVLSLILCLGMVVPALADVSVSATGTVTAAPDTIFVSAGVFTEDKSADVALKDNNAKMSKIIDALVNDFEVNKKFISTSQFSVSPKTEYINNKRVFVGYSVSNQVTVKIKDLDTVGKILTALTENGANRINGVSFTIEDNDELIEKARVLAVKKAKEKASTLIVTAGAELGRIKSISESTSYNRSGMYKSFNADSLRSAAGGESTPISGGQLKVTVTVNATFSVQ